MNDFNVNIYFVTFLSLIWPMGANSSFSHVIRFASVIQFSKHPPVYSSSGCACVLSRVPLFAIPWTIPHQAPLSMGFSRQEFWSGLLFPSPGSFPDPGIKPMSPESPTLAGGFFTTEPPGKPKPYLIR